MRGIQPSERASEQARSAPESPCRLSLSLSLSVSVSLSLAPSVSLSLARSLSRSPSLWDDLGMVVCEDEGGQRGV